MSIETKLFANGYFSSNAFIEGGAEVAAGSMDMKMYANGNTQIVSMVEQSLYQLNSFVSNISGGGGAGAFNEICTTTVANTGDLLCIAFLTSNGSTVNCNVNGVLSTFIGNTHGPVFNNFNLYYFYYPNAPSGVTTVVASSNNALEGMYVLDYSGPNTNPFIGSSNVQFTGSQASGANNIYSGNVVITVANNVLVWGFAWDPQVSTATGITNSPGTAFTPFNFFIASGGAGGILDTSDEVLIASGVTNANAQFSGSQFNNYGVCAAVFALNPPSPCRLYANGTMSVNAFYEA